MKRVPYKLNRGNHLQVFIVMLQVEILNPAVDGTLNVLRSCKKNPRLRRVVLTSSSSTVRVRDNIDPNIPLDESSWSSVEFCKKFEVNTSILITFYLISWY